MRFAPLTFALLACATSGSDHSESSPLASAVEPDTSSPHSTYGNPQTPASLPAPRHSPPDRIRCLKAGYPGIISAIEQEEDKWVVVVNSDTRLIWDDGKDKSYEEKLRAPDLEDQMSLAYPKGPVDSPPDTNDDPGRFRVEAFFKAVYGADRRTVKERLEPVPWLPTKGAKPLMFNRTNGAAEHLAMVSRELTERLSKTALRFVAKPGGTFNWRRIAGTDRLSAHAFGAAIDIDVKLGDYWRWGKRQTPLVYRNRVPHKIVSIFEKHGFIWGGKWYHFDTMHFEYRPALLAQGCER